MVKGNRVYYYRILIENIPERIRGIEVKNVILKTYLLIVKWTGYEVFIKSSRPIYSDHLLISFYTEKEDGAYRKVEAKIKDIEQIRTFKVGP